MQMIRVRVKATRQVLDMVPDVARRMIAGGTAEEVSQVENMTRAVAERAIAPAQGRQKNKPARRTA